MKGILSKMSLKKVSMNENSQISKLPIGHILTDLPLKSPVECPSITHRL